MHCLAIRVGRTQYPITTVSRIIRDYLQDKGEREEFDDADIVACSSLFQQLIPGFNVQQYVSIWKGLEPTPEGNVEPGNDAAD
jgi:hypothetical protein